MCDRCLTIRKQAKTQGLELVIDISLSVQRFIADERRLKQMLLNLLPKAIKFTSVGKISLIVRKTLPGISLTVVNTGIGFIPG